MNTPTRPHPDAAANERPAADDLPYVSLGHPAYAPRRLGRVFLPGAAVFFVTIGLSAAAVAGLAPWAMVIFFAVASPLAMALTVRAIARAEKKLRAELHDKGFCACLRCGYDLSKGPAEGRCPECSLPYRAERTRAAWVRSFGDPEE